MLRAIFRNEKQITMMNATTATKKDIIFEITNFPIKEKKSILLDVTKVSNICQNVCISNVLMLKPIKLLNKPKILTQNLLLLVPTLWL